MTPKTRVQEGVFLYPDSVFEDKFMVPQFNPSEPMPSRKGDALESGGRSGKYAP
jgi:hypothetical protein